MVDRLALERYQVWIYLVAIGAGLVLGSWQPGLGATFAALLWPALVLLLYVTFVQVPLLHLREAFGDRRFVVTLLGGNFVVLPLLVGLPIAWLPLEPAVRLGVLLVLLVPCTDWFLTFSQLGDADVPRAIASTPILLLLQLLLLPFYIGLFAGADVVVAFQFAEIWSALLIVLVPLALAAVSERWIEARRERAVWRERLAWGPVPLLALVVFLIAGAQVGAVYAALDVLLIVAPIFVGFLALAALVARTLSGLSRTPVAQRRTLAFSFGTRNSFVVLPIALTLPAGWELVAVVIVVQSLVELFGMIFYLWWVPWRLFG
jgi:ACR3 family arsenite efflux pump ArsB